VCRREGLAWVKDQDILTVMDGNVILIRMLAVKRWTFPSDKLFITGFINEGHFRSDYKVADL
jgi:hypothetical protein